LVKSLFLCLSVYLASSGIRGKKNLHEGFELGCFRDYSKFLRGIASFVNVRNKNIAVNN